MRISCDLLVIGAGKSGLTASLYASSLGAKTILVEQKEIRTLTNDYAFVDNLYSLTSFLIQESYMKSKGFPITRVNYSIQDILKKFHDSNSKTINYLEVLQQNNVQLEFGVFHFTDENKGIIEKEEGILEVQFKKCIIATGSKPLIPPIKGLNNIPYFTYQNILSCKELPKELIVLGAGPTGVQLAQVFRRLGSKVKLIQRSDQILSKEEKIASTSIYDSLKSDGIEIYLNSIPLEFINEHNLIKVKIRSSNGKNFEITGTSVLLSTGVVPVFESLNLEKAEIEYDLQSIKLNDFLLTTNKRVYVIGEATLKENYTQFIKTQARIAVKNALFTIPILSRKEKFSSYNVPYTIFSDPELSRVGLTEEQCSDLDLNYTVHVVNFSEVDSRLGNGFLKIITDKSNFILGATCIGLNSSSTINEISLAMSKKLTLNDLWDSIRVEESSNVVLSKLCEKEVLSSLKNKKSLLKLLFKLKN